RRQTETDSGGDSDGGSCAAAHVMGKANPNLNILRAFRDDILAKSAIGSKLIKVYYTAGDAMIGYLDKHPRAKKAAANLLNRLSK
ncbi:MAG: hypothetical protein GY868_13715, partial [Deltaproteobacteria bacterium]|nr:hypothetical protein [Deltaproteobacteria bacterium]